MSTAPPSRLSLKRRRAGLQSAPSTGAPSGRSAYSLEAFIVFKKPRRMSSFQAAAWRQLTIDHWEPAKFSDWPDTETSAFQCDIDFGSDRRQAASKRACEEAMHTTSCMLQSMPFQTPDPQSIEHDHNRATVVAQPSQPYSYVRDDTGMYHAAKRAKAVPFTQYDHDCAIIDAALRSMSEGMVHTPWEYNMHEVMTPVVQASYVHPYDRYYDFGHKFGLSDVWRSTHMPPSWTLPLSVTAE